MATLCAVTLIMLGAGAGAWWFVRAPEPEPMPEALPMPPFPPRIASDDNYERCLTLLTEDPSGAEATAESWQTKGGGDGAVHCLALAQIATGQLVVGATLLERLGQASAAAGPARALVLGQAAQARMLAEQPGQALRDATAALALAPDDLGLLIYRASVAARLGRHEAAIEDLTAALARDPERADALVARAASWRAMNRLDRAGLDIARAIELNPDDPEAWLERGIQRQRIGDSAGARSDWEHARGLDPNGAVADMAEQNLALLDASPEEQ
jgi:tetratricopeptide (TPR) repeat protein